MTRRNKVCANGMARVHTSFYDTTGQRRRARKSVVDALNGILARNQKVPYGPANLIEPFQVLMPGTCLIKCHVEGWSACAVRNAHIELENGEAIELSQTRALAAEFRLARGLPDGVHKFCLEVDVAGQRLHLASVLIVAPALCHRLLPGDRARILAVQLYAVRTKQNWGIGDFRDLKEVMGIASAAGYRYIALNPLHRLSYDVHCSVSPYSPESRYFLNWIYLDVEAVPGYCELARLDPANFGPALRETLQSLRSGSFVDYTSVAKLKRTALMALAKLASADRENAYFSSFRLFCELNQDAIRAYTRARLGAGADLEAEFQFDIFTEWCCRAQLEACVRSGHDVGLLLDLAIGAAGGSAEVRASPNQFARGVSIGAPPDSFNAQGQNWNLAPFDPESLRVEAYAPFVKLLDANMPSGGGIRIDHIMWLCRQYWILDGASAGSGAYVAFPEADLLALIRLMSARKKCIVLGEDLGTVPRGFRNRLRASGIYTMHVARFEREKSGAFRSWAKFNSQSALFLSTHDMAPIASYASGADIELDVSIGLKPKQGLAAEVKRRAEEIEAFRTCVGLSGRSGRKELHSQDLLGAARAAALRSPCQLVVDCVDDQLLETTPVNIPGTVEEYPNWRRKYGREIDVECLSLQLPASPKNGVKSSRQGRKRRH